MMTAWIRSNICKEPTIRRLLPSLVKITWPTMLGSSRDWALVSAARRENPGNEYKSVVESFVESSLETHGQTVGARESLNGRKNMARRKVKNGEKK